MVPVSAYVVIRLGLKDTATFGKSEAIQIARKWALHPDQGVKMLIFMDRNNNVILETQWAW
jgi:hypothetical protein